MADESWSTSAWIDDENFRTDHFRMFEFKVKRCPRAKPHDWTACPFAHPTEKAKRRCPVNYRYNGTACTDFRKNGNCRRGDACPFAHGVFEAWLHPARYRTKMCTDAGTCKRRVCFFAHRQEDLRRPTEDSDIADLRTELLTQSQQQQHERRSFGNSVSDLLAATQLDNMGERHTVLQLLQQQMRNQQMQQQLQAYQMALQQAATQEQLDQELLINQSLLGAHNGLMAATGTEGSQATAASLAARDAHARLLSPQRPSFSGLGPAPSLDHEMAFFSPGAVDGSPFAAPSSQVNEDWLPSITGTTGSRRSSMDVVSMSTHNSFADGFGHNYAGSTGALQPAGSARQSLEEMMGSLSSNQSDAVNFQFARETLFGFGQQALSAAPGNGFSQAVWSHPNQEAGGALQNGAANGMMLHTSSAELTDDLLRQHGSIGLPTVPEIATPRSSAEEPKGLDQAVVSNVTFPARSSLDLNGSSPMAQHPSVDRMLSELPRTLSEMNL